jgi:EAL domain-containing protein (putative c-di-GMP-specific phosphodiesterase class I)
MGVRIVLDDFGTGYSSLSYLRNLPIDEIKIDRSFVADLERDASATIVGAVVSLSHGLGFEVVAEGIETAGQADRLRALGVDLGQGYLWSPAVEPARADVLLRRGVSGRGTKTGRLLPIRLSGGPRAAAAGTGRG